MTSADRAADPGSPSVVRPFEGLLVTAEWAGRVVSPMLDVLGPDAHARLLAEQRHSWLHVTTAIPTESARPTEAAALQALLDAGAYAETPPGLYVYGIADDHGEHVGVVADVALSAFVDGRVRGHEGVQPERVASLLRHFERVPARSELVALLHPARSDVEAAVAAARVSSPILEFTSADGLRQTVRRLDESASAELAGVLAERPLYVADGHHRVAASLRAWEQAGRPPGDRIPCVLYAPGGLRLEAFHRRVRGPVDAAALVAALRREFAVAETDRAEVAIGHIAVYVGGRWLSLDTSAAEPGVAGLDVGRLHGRVLEPVLGIGPAGDPRLEVMPANEPLEVLIARCDADGGAVFALAAPSIAQLVDVADRGEVMMAKSTFFAPKPQAGIFLQLTG